MDWLAPFACSFVGCFSVVPTALAAAAVVDVLRVRAEWWWIPVALMFPVVGPLVYFAVAYGPWAGSARPLSPVTAQRRAARRRLRELRVQIAHWRGPALLAEAGFGPERFERLTALVEWRFLGREEAIGWAVPAHFRSDWRSARRVLSMDEAPYADAGPAALRSFTRERDAARLKVEDLEARARQARELSPPTRALLEARQPRIEALDPSMLDPLLDLLDTTRGGSVYDYE